MVVIYFIRFFYGFVLVFGWCFGFVVCLLLGIVVYCCCWFVVGYV